METEGTTSASNQGPLNLTGSLPEAYCEAETSLNKAVWDRRAEYTVPKTIRVKVGTWNVAAIQGTEKDVGGWFVGGKGVLKELSGLRLDGLHHNVSLVQRAAGMSRAGIEHCLWLYEGILQHEHIH